MLKFYFVFCLIMLNHIQIVCSREKAKPTISSSSHQTSPRHKKKYVIEVQDHQQAMRYANPLVDLEDTVRKGINNPLSDPRFIMDQINGNEIGTGVNTETIPPAQNNLFRNQELLSYRDRPTPESFIRNLPQSNSIMSFNKHNLNSQINNQLTPNLPMQEQAMKEQIVARHPPNIPMMSDMYNPPLRPFRQPAMISNMVNRNIMNSLSGVSNTEISALFRNDIAGGLNQGLLGGVAPLDNSGLAAAFRRGEDVRKAQSLKNELPLLLRLKNLREQILQKSLENSVNENESNKLENNLKLSERLLNQQNLLNKQNLLNRQNLMHRQYLLEKQKLLDKQKMQNRQNLLNKQNLINKQNILNRQKLLQAELMKRKNKMLNKGKTTNINPLTGLPEDLEANSYASVSSITSMSEPQSMPSSVTVNTDERPVHVNSESESLTSSSQSLHEQPQQQENPIKDSSLTSSFSSSSSLPEPSSVSSSTSPAAEGNKKTELEQSFPSLKSFLEADSILRQKLNTEALSAPTDLSDPDKALGQGSINLGPGFDISVGDSNSKSDEAPESIATTRRATINLKNMVPLKKSFIEHH